MTLITPSISEVRDQLRHVLDPCSLRSRQPVDIVAMGLVGRLDIQGQTVRLDLVLTEPTCLFGGAIAKAIETALLELDGVAEVEVSMDVETVWTPDRAEPEAQELVWPRPPVTTGSYGPAEAVSSDE